MITTIHKIKIIIAIILCALIMHTPCTHAQTNEINKTKQQLNQLELKIKSLKNQLQQANDKHNLLENELTKTNQQIGSYSAKIKKIQTDIDAKEQAVTALKAQITEINTKLEKTHKKIAIYLVEQYKNHDMQKLKLLFKQKNLLEIDKLLTYYQYLIKANKQLLTEFQLHQSELANKNAQLNNELQALQSLKMQWGEYLKNLQNDKKYKTEVVKQLSTDIHKKQQTMQDYRQNQINLSKLIANLTSRSVLQTKKPMIQIKGKITKPIDAPSSKIKKINQGLIFYAPEGQTVRAVSAGKVVFADWLNGYGLLIIIDHGWSFMSLYGNNAQLLKRVGDNVALGEQIAKIGHSGVFSENGLYFEIRHHGKAMPPEQWLKQ